MDLASFYNQFREETSENLRVLSDGLLALERSGDAPATGDDPEASERLNAVFRAVHTIKGSARLLGFGTIGELAHTMENILGNVRDGKQTLSRDLTDAMLRGGDALQALTTAAVEGQESSVDVAAILAVLSSSSVQPVLPPGSAPSQPAPEPVAPQPDPPIPEPVPEPVPAPVPAVAAPEPAPAPAPALVPPAKRPGQRDGRRQTIRVRTERLDQLINLTGELVIEQQTLSIHAHALQELASLLQQQTRGLLALEAELRQQRYASPEQQAQTHQVNTLLNGTDRANALLHQQLEQFAHFMNQHTILVGDLEQEVITTRLLPIATIFASLPRAVRELANATQKEVELELHGETTELDRKLLEALSDPLVHIVRNGVDHGIEPPDERAAQGKPRQGRMLVQAEAVGVEVRIRIQDDGRGIAPQRVREIAVKKGLLAAEHAALLSDQEALELVFLPGFTTAPMITDISGRGVGMDVVRTNIAELNGHVIIESQPGQGTSLTLVLPVTLVTTRVLLVQVGRQTLALPASGCHGIAWVQHREVRTIEGRPTILYDGHTMPVIRMADLLQIEAEPLFVQRDRLPAVIIGSGQRRLCLLVERLIDEREAVVKPVGPLLERQRHYTGAIQLGDGSLVLMLNPVVLAQIARGSSTPRLQSAANGNGNQQRLLVADDSFTTRELIRSILQSAGYQVTAAMDGLDALDKLKAHPYDLVVSDVEMPRMDGFELTASMRREASLQDVPVIIITSLASEEHRRRGMEAGAQAYIVKSQFNQDNLLQAIQQLLGA